MEDVVRAAGAPDAGAVARVHVLGWQAGYRGLVDDAYLDALSVEVHRRRWAQGLAEGSRVLLCERGGEVVGFVCHGPRRSEDLPDRCGEVYALYVLPSVWGSGVGGRLLDAAVGEQERDGCTGSALWVLEGNDRARRFYEGHGWRPDGAVRTERRPGASPQEVVTLHEVRYRRVVGTGGSRR